MKKIGVTGYKGRLGSYLLQSYPSTFFPLEWDVAPDSNEPDDIQKHVDATTNYIRSVQPDLVLHLASKSGVDFCEDVKNENLVIRTNVNGTFAIACATELLGIETILLSSSYVFNGKKWFGKYKENDVPDPVNFYGRTKMGAESLATLFDNLKIIRTSYLFDNERMDKIRSAHDEGMTQNFPTFIKRSFIYLPHFAELIYSYCTNIGSMPNILHLAGCDSVSWFDFVHAFAYASGYDMNTILPRNQEEDGHAPRGKNLGLDTSFADKLGFPSYSYLQGIKDMLG